MGKATLVLFLGVVALVAAKPYEKSPLVSGRELSQLYNGEPLSESYLLKLYERLLEITPARPQGRVPDSSVGLPDDQAEAEKDQPSFGSYPQPTPQSLEPDADDRQGSEASGDQEESPWEDEPKPDEGDEEPVEAPVDEPAEEPAADAPEQPAEDQPQPEGADPEEQPSKDQQPDAPDGEGDQQEGEQAPPKDHEEVPKQGDRPEKQEKPEGGHRPPKAPQGDSEDRQGPTPKPDGQNRPPKGEGRKPRGPGGKPSGPQEAGPRRNPDAPGKPSKSAAPLVQINVNIAPGV